MKVFMDTIVAPMMVKKKAVATKCSIRQSLALMNSSWTHICIKLPMFYDNLPDYMAMKILRI